MSCRGTVLFLLLLACGDDDVPTDANVRDSSVDAVEAEDAPSRDVPELDAPEFDVGPRPDLTTCVEVESMPLEGGAVVWPGDVTTEDGVVILDADNAGRATIRFSLDEAREVSLWARVRAPTHANNSVFVGLDELPVEPVDASSWDIPVTPVLSWQRIIPRGAGEEWRPADQAWPGTVSAGAHELVVSGREASVELDAFCVTSADARPSPRHAPIPEHADIVEATGLVGDGEADDTEALQAALDSLSEGQTLRLPAGTFRTTQFVRINRNDVTFEGTMSGDERMSALFLDHPVGSPNGSTAGILVVGGGAGDASPLLEDAGSLGRTLVVEADFEIAVGDMVRVDSDDHGAINTDVGRPHFRDLRTRGVVMERLVEGSRATLTLDRPILEAFTTTNNAQVSKYEARTNVVIQNMRIDGTQRQLGDDDSFWTDEEMDRNAAMQFVRMRRVAHSAVRNLEISHFRQQAILLNDSFGIQVMDNFIHDSTDFRGNGNGYGLATTLAQGIDVYNNTLRGVMRHSLSFSVGTHESRMIDNDMVRGRNEDEPGPNHLWACIDIHGEHSYGLLIARNQTVNGEYGVILGGGFGSHGNDGSWIVIRDNVFEGAFGGGAGSNDHTYNAIIENNTLTGNRRGVHLFYSNDDTFVWNNTIDASADHGVFVADSDGTQVLGNTITNSGGDDLHFDEDCSEYDVRSNSYSGSVTHPGAGNLE